ncbi:MAG: hypothetical protein MI919_08175 [Holophagales bacterium]|nr:hypothetical protein [Holophagales bacterium]
MPPAACAAAGRVDLETGDTTLRSPIAPTPLHCVRVRPGTGLLLAEAQTILDPMELRIAVFDAGCRAAPERLLDVSLSWALIETTEAPVHICVASRVPAAPLGPFALRLAATRLGGPGAPDLGTAGHKTEGDSTSDPIEPDPEGLGTALGLCTPGIGDDHADGVACATPVKTEGTVEGRLERLDDLDLFRFELPAEATVRAQAAGVYLHLLDAEGRPVGTPGETLATPLERVMPAGVWHLRVSARPSSATAGGDLHRPYRLLLALAEPAW